MIDDMRRRYANLIDPNVTAAATPQSMMINNAVEAAQKPMSRAGLAAQVDPNVAKAAAQAPAQPNNDDMGIFQYIHKGILGATGLNPEAGKEQQSSPGVGTMLYNSAKGIANMPGEIYHAADRLTQATTGYGITGTPRTANAPRDPELGDYSPGMDTLTVAGAMPVGGLLSAGARGGESVATRAIAQNIETPRADVIAPHPVLDMEVPKKFDPYNLRPEHNKTAQAMYGKYMDELPRHLQDNVSQTLIDRNWNAPPPQPKKVANDPFVAGDGSTFYSNPNDAKTAGVFNALTQQHETPGITAYHGSPHDFDKFSLDKIGTGEGAQAYGHGLYFADAEATAKSYKDAGPAASQHYDKINGELTRLAREMDKYRGPQYGTYTDPKGYELKAQYDDLMQQRTKVGKMYQVRINADPESFLDWDKPLSQQPGILEQFGYHDAKYPEDWIPDVNMTGAQLYRLHAGGGRTNDGARGGGGLASGHNGLSDSGPRTIKMKDGTHKDIPLRIPGIKYLDQGSRGAGEGSRNYVVFDDKIIDIVKKYGIAAAAAMYGMDRVMQATDAQASPQPEDPVMAALKARRAQQQSAQ